MFNITFQQIETFLNIARYMNLSKAAEAMYISQPALSKTLQRFEEGIGLKLFNRGNHGVTLTREGEYLYSTLESLYNSLNKTINTALAIAEVPPKVIHFVVPSSFDVSDAYDRIKEIVSDFEERYPDVVISESLSDFRELRQLLEFSGVDLAVTHDFVIEDIPNISYKRVDEFQLYIAMSINHPIASTFPIDVDALSKEVIYKVAHTDEEKSAQKTIEQCRTLGFEPKKVIFVPNFHTLFHRIREKNAISLCGRFNYFGEEDEVKYFPLPYEENQQYVVLAWPTGKLSRETKAFIDLLPGEEYSTSNQ